MPCGAVEGVEMKYMCTCTDTAHTTAPPASLPTALPPCNHAASADDSEPANHAAVLRCAVGGTMTYTTLPSGRAKIL